jgi:LacI family transcriptional regulator
MPVTIADIAARVGKSRQLVSAVLNGGLSGAKSSPATQAEIHRVAEAMGYRPNSAARAVSTGRFDTIGLLLSTTIWKSSLRLETLMGITAALAESELRLTVSGLPDETLVDGANLPTSLRRTHADGFLICYDTAIPPEMTRLLEALQVPVVWLNSLHAADCVVPDEEQAGRLVTEELLRRGHHRILYLDSFPRERSNHFASGAKADGYVAAMQAAGCQPWLANERPYGWEERQARIHDLLARPERPTAVIAADGDDDPASVLYAAQALGLRVPIDLSLATIAPSPPHLAGLTIATALRPVTEVGRAGVAMLQRRLAAPSQRQVPVRLPFAFDPGASLASQS